MMINQIARISKKKFKSYYQKLDNYKILGMKFKKA